MRNGRFTYIASKNGAELGIMIGVKTFLVTEYGKLLARLAWAISSATAATRLDCATAPPAGCGRAFLRRMAEAGCSEDYIASISGHRDMREIRRCVQAANKARMATAGMAKTLAAFPVNNAEK